MNALDAITRASGRVLPFRKTPWTVMPADQKPDIPEVSKLALARGASQLLASAVIGVFAWDASGRIVFGNPAFLSLLRYSADDVSTGAMRWSAILPGPPPAAMDAGRGRPGWEAAFRRKDGSSVWCLTSGRFESAEGSAILLDLTDRKRRELEQGLLHDALTVAANAVVITNRQGIIEWVNPAFTAITGYTAEEALGQTPRLLKSGLLKPAFYEKLWSTLVSGQVWQGEFVNRRKDGTLYVEEQSITPVRRDAQITHFIAIKQDISERRRAEAALRESEKRFRDLFEQSLDAILVTDPELRILDANPATERLFGWPREALIGQSGTNLAADPRARERFFQTLRDRGVVRDFEVAGRTRDGSIVEVQVNAVPRWDETGRLLGYVAIARDITSRKRFEDELQHLAFHDWLTGLPNLALFRDRLEHAVSRADRAGARLALIFMDLDRFKGVNDGHGHNVGDRAIQQVARRLLACFREEDTVARIGGDEFTVIVERLTGLGQLTHVLDRVVNTLSAPLQVDGHQVRVDASIGATLYQGLESADIETRGAEDLFRKADAAMYQAKRQPGTRYHIFDPATDQDGTMRIRQQQELRRAIDEDQLTTHYQPVIALGSGELWGVEVLARWIHPERGTLGPAEFIPLAEECGLIAPLGEWILRRACRDLAGWIERGAVERLRLLVNLSARQLEDRDLAARLEAVLQSNGIPPSWLDFEVTETMAVHHPNRVKALRDMGASVSVDDFGTGYSSLRYLKDLEVDGLKIEIGFVQGMENDAKLAAIVRTIVKLGADLGLDVIAEGIETETHLSMIREMGCPLGQGYLFSRPLDAATFEKELQRYRVAMDAALP